MNDKLNFDSIPTTDEGYISLLNGCVGFNDGYRFLSLCRDELVKTVDKDDFDIF